MNQKGFATLEVILMVVVIGILATIAVPRFEKITGQANTAKVQSDLAAINAAVETYRMEKGSVPSYSDLEEYFENGFPEAPSGKVYVNGELEDMSGKKYSVDTTSGKATFDSKTADKFTSKTTSTTTGGNG